VATVTVVVVAHMAAGVLETITVIVGVVVGKVARVIHTLDKVAA
jgi:hypothetical protein